MDCHPNDCKKITRVFDASQRKRSKKKRDGFDETMSGPTDESTVGCTQADGRGSDKASLPDVSMQQDINGTKRDSSPSQAHSPDDLHRSTLRSRRKHRKPPVKDGISLALKAGLVSTPRSDSPTQGEDGLPECIPQDQDSFIYAFLEEAIKKDKKKQRHARHLEERRRSYDREASARRQESEQRDCEPDICCNRDPDHNRDRQPDRNRHRHHHRHRELLSRDRDKKPEERPPFVPAVNQAALIETFAKMCAQITEKDLHYKAPTSPVPRCHSNKSLQCEVINKKSSYDVNQQPVRLNSHSGSRDIFAKKIRSQENCAKRLHSNENLLPPNEMDRYKHEKYMYYYNRDAPKYPAKLDTSRSRMRHCEDERYRDYSPMLAPTRSCINPQRKQPENTDHRDLEREYTTRRYYNDDKRKYIEQKTSRSFDAHREYQDDERVRRTARSDTRDRRYEERDKRYYDMGKYYNEKLLESRDRITDMSCKDRRWRKNFERFEKNSITSRDDDRDRDGYSEKERDSGLSVADGDTSTVSGRSNYLKVVKQQISEQREAMDKMMNLWKELMRCFKGISQAQCQDKNVKETAANVHESAAEHMRLWWECMRRYETVARDVGDTDARLMEEIKKQRSEMAEMASMWQECLQRYRDISNDFNNLKQQLVTPESPTRLPGPPLLCAAEGEGAAAAAAYRLPPTYPPVPAVVGMGGRGVPPGASGYGRTLSPLHGRSSAPPAWWWSEAEPRSPRRRSSPDSRASRERDKDRRHRHKDREETTTRYKDKSSKPSAARSEHRHRKR